MKYFTFLLFAFGLLVACKNETSLRDQANTTTTPTTTSPATTPAQAPSGSVAHYICSTPGCAGAGAGSAGSCSVCGNALTHNQAYHANQQSQPNIAAEGLSPILTQPQGQTTTPAATAEPAQNAAGVWHYTCSNGCAGGAGSATACATCGNTLAHNTAYHN